MDYYINTIYDVQNKKNFFHHYNVFEHNHIFELSFLNKVTMQYWNLEFWLFLYIYLR